MVLLIVRTVCFYLAWSIRCSITPGFQQPSLDAHSTIVFILPHQLHTWSPSPALNPSQCHICTLSLTIHIAYMPVHCSVAPCHAPPPFCLSCMLLSSIAAPHCNTLDQQCWIIACNSASSIPPSHYCHHHPIVLYIGTTINVIDHANYMPNQA